MAEQTWPVKNQAYVLDFVIRKNDGTIVANPTGLVARVAKDGAASAAATNPPACYDTTYGLCAVALTADSMNADRTVVKITATDTGAIPTVVVLNPGVAPAKPSTPMTLASGWGAATDIAAGFTSVLSGAFNPDTDAVTVGGYAEGQSPADFAPDLSPVTTALSGVATDVTDIKRERFNADRRERTATGITRTVRDDADENDLWSQAITDDGATATKGALE